MPAKRAGPVMRMTPPRYTRRIRNWPNAGTGRTTCSTRTDVETALAAGQKITLADGVTIGTTGDPAIVIPSGADIRGASYGGATFNVNLSLTAVSQVVLEGFRMGSRASILGDNAASVYCNWITCLGAGFTDYGIRFQHASDIHLYGCIARRCRIYGFSLEGSVPLFLPCSIRQSRWEQITHTPAVLDGVTECGINMAGYGTISGCEGSGSGWAEIRLENHGGPPSVIENARLEGRIGIDVQAGAGIQIRRCRITPSLYGITNAPIPGILGSSTIEDITIQGGVWGLNFEQVPNPVVQRITAHDQSSASIRQAGGALLLDLASCDLQPAPGGVPYLFVP